MKQKFGRDWAPPQNFSLQQHTLEEWWRICAFIQIQTLPHWYWKG